MCVKEFIGYHCGHCSVPEIRKCPTVAANTHFPICAFPAEHPIRSFEYCHPCSRVVWNSNVLREEEEHRERHLQGDWCCDIIFNGEDREERLRACASREYKGQSYEGEGKGKGPAEENSNIEFSGFGPSESGATGYSSTKHQFGSDKVKDGAIKAEAEAAQSTARMTCEPEARQTAYEYAGYYTGNEDFGQVEGQYLAQDYFCSLPQAENFAPYEAEPQYAVHSPSQPSQLALFQPPLQQGFFPAPFIGDGFDQAQGFGQPDQQVFMPVMPPQLYGAALAYPFSSPNNHLAAEVSQRYEENDTGMMKWYTQNTVPSMLPPQENGYYSKNASVGKAVSEPGLSSNQMPYDSSTVFMSEEKLSTPAEASQPAIIRSSMAYSN